jgi:nucleoside-diphosphate-sugar epimerase
MTNKKALICGAGGFIGTHLARQLKKEGYFVRGVGIKKPKYSKTACDEFLLLDLTKQENCAKALKIKGGFDEVYQLAADRGGVGYMAPFETEMMSSNALINIYMVTEAVKYPKKPLYFFSSSVCVYKDMKIGDKEIMEEDAYPAHPDNEYGWEKLYSERLIQAFSRKYRLPIRIARFHTTYGPESNWEGGREKAADALCRKAALAPNGGKLEVWGNGKQVRLLNFIDDLISAIRALMKSGITGPTNLGGQEYVTVDHLAKAVIYASGKKLTIKHITGPVGVISRRFSSARLYSTGWRPKFTLQAGINIHYAWVSSQVAKKYGKVDNK